MQNSQVLSQEQTPKQALILKFWQWVWLSPSPSRNSPDEPPCRSSWWTAGRRNPHHHRAQGTLYPRPSGPSPDFWTCSPCVSHWHTLPNPWPSNPLPAKICKTHKCCHENKHTNKPWFYSFGNRYGCPLPRAWMVLTSLLADLLGGLLVEEILIIIGLERHCFLVHLGPLPTSGLALLASVIGMPCPIHGPPILFLQRYAKPTSVVTINTQTNIDSTVLATSMVVPFPKPERSWRASLLIFLVDCWWKKSSSSSGSRDTLSSSIWALSRLLDLLSLGLSLAHLAQPMALQSSSCKNMQNSQVLSREQTPKQGLILQFWQWVWLSPSQRKWKHSRYRDCSLTSAMKPDPAVSAITEPKCINRHDRQNTSNVISANNALLKGILPRQPTLELMNQTKHTTSYVSLLTHGWLCAGAGLCASQGEQNFHEYYAWGVCESNLAPSSRALMEIPDSAKPPLGSGILRFLVLACLLDPNPLPIPGKRKKDIVRLGPQIAYGNR